MAANLVSVSYEQCRREYFENEMQKAKNRADYWAKRLEKAPSGTRQLEAHDNASNAGWEVNYYKDALKALDAMPKWISVDERLPEDGQRVVAICENGMAGIMDYKDDGTPFAARIFGCYFSNITHWMPLPEPPKEGE